MALSLKDALAQLPAIQAELDAFFTKLIAASPAALQGDEAAVQAALDAVLTGVDLPTLESSVASLFEAIKAGRSIQGGGADATLA